MNFHSCDESFWKEFYKVQNPIEKSVWAVVDWFGLPNYDMDFQTRSFHLGLACGNKLSCLLSSRTHAVMIKLHWEDHDLSSVHETQLGLRHS